MGFFDKIKAGLTKTREALGNTLGGVFSGFSEIDDDFYDELEESLILADLGVETSVKATERLRKAVREQHLKTTEDAKIALKQILVQMLDVGSTQLDLSTKPSVILVIGVNGVGKTTTIGKIATQLTKQGRMCFWWQAIPSAPPLPTSWKSGRSVPALPSCGSMRALILPLWCMTASSLPRRRAQM